VGWLRKVYSATVHIGDLFGIVSALSFIVDHEVFWRDAVRTLRIVLDIVLDGTDEGLPASTTILQRVLQYLYQRAIA